MDERADGLADLGVVSQEPVAAALDGHELGSRDAVCRLGREAVRCEGVIFLAGGIVLIVIPVRRASRH